MLVDGVLAELTRGVVDLHERAELEERLVAGKPLRVKAGFDPTRPDLHLGHTVLMQKMRQFQDAGHQVVFVVGDFTAMVGDPTGRSDARPRLTREEVLASAETYKAQAFKILDEARTEVRYNSEWLAGLPLDQVISLASRRTVARTLERRDFRERFEQSRDIYLHELLYPLLQGYDSVALDADLELGGTDQLFNLMVGRDLMRSYGKRPQLVMTVPILEGLDARLQDGKVVGKKMSKSANNAIGLTEPPLEMFRKVMQIDDGVIWRFYELLSSRSAEDVAKIREENNPLSAKRTFAEEIITRYHDASAASEARREFEATYLKDGIPDQIDELSLATEGAGLALSKALSDAGLVKSTSEGRRLIEQGGVEVDHQRVTDVRHQLTRGQRYLLRVGSKKRRFAYVTVLP
ncbi:MAG: tyrosine--tRNA ligase [Polyangiaceae bacterium]|nr:tyrosine--tRNA ligase [Polyangiaceae bacterium]MCW5789535.1 tyrosine--tRNA ligase [Polyangiaceae bacterium]